MFAGQELIKILDAKDLGGCLRIELQVCPHLPVRLSLHFDHRRECTLAYEVIVNSEIFGHFELAFESIMCHESVSGRQR